MRIGYYVLTLIVFLLAACGGGVSAVPGPVSTVEPVPSADTRDQHREVLPSAEIVARADNSLIGSAGPSTSEPPLCPSAQVGDAQAFLEEVIRLTNVERAKVQAEALTIQAQLTEAAQVHALDMGCNLFMSHTGSDGSSSFERMTRFGYVYSAAAENVAAGYATPAEVVQGWMGSPGHRENMLNSTYTEIGIGYIYNAAEAAEGNYFHYWVMTLGQPAWR